MYFQKVVIDSDVTRVTVSIDGNRVPSTWVLTGPGKYRKKKLSTLEASGNEFRRLVFGSIELTGRFSARVQYHASWSIAIVVVIAD